METSGIGRATAKRRHTASVKERESQMISTTAGCMWLAAVVIETLCTRTQFFLLVHFLFSICSTWNKISLIWDLLVHFNFCETNFVWNRPFVSLLLDGWLVNGVYVSRCMREYDMKMHIEVFEPIRVKNKTTKL
jgi:hypothetical protein